jgi:hypothetical protein
MKEVRCSVLQKGQTLVASILLGCPYTSSINHRLVPDQVSAADSARIRRSVPIESDGRFR